jgi:hypothetical protein
MILVLAVGLTAESAAQAVRTQTVTNSQGEPVETPYLSRTELMDTYLGGPHGSIRLGQIKTVVSIDEAVHLLGEPDSTDITDYPQGVRYNKHVVLFYTGLKVTYVDVAGKVRLETMEINSGNYYLKIGEKELKPGMHPSEIDENIRKGLINNKSISTNSYNVKISSKDEANFVQHTALSVKVDPKNNVLTQIRYYTVI